MTGLDEQVDKRDFERRLQTLAQAIILTIVLGIGYAVIDLTKAAARQEVRNEQNSKDIADLKAEMMSIRTQTANAAIAAALAATTAAAAAANNVPNRKEKP